MSTIPDKDFEIITLKQKINRLESQNKTLSSKLITQQEETQGPLQFLDALENLLLDHGFKVVSVDE